MEDEKRKIFSESISSNPQTSKKGRTFLLTGFRKKEIKHICFVIAQLGATCLSDNKTKENILNCTHVIAKKPCRSEKFLSACAAGKWILIDQYLFDCLKRKKWLPEGDYEWGIQQLDISNEISLAKASSRWRRKLHFNHENPPFHNWLVGLFVNESFVVYKRLVEIGGGKVADLSLGFNPAITHVMSMSKNLSSELSEYQKRGIPVVPCAYLAEHLLQDSSSPDSSSRGVAQPETTMLSCSPNNQASSTALSPISSGTRDSGKEQSHSQQDPSDCDFPQITEVTPELSDTFMISKQSKYFDTSNASVPESILVQQTNAAAVSASLLTPSRPCHSLNDDNLANKTPKNPSDLSVSKCDVNVNEMIVSKVRQDTDYHTESDGNVQFQSNSTSQTDQEWKKRFCDESVRQDHSSVTLVKSNETRPSLKVQTPASYLIDFTSTTDPSSNLRPQSYIALISEGLNKKRQLIESAISKLKKEKEDLNTRNISIRTNIDHVTPPQRFGNREISMMENIVDASHGGSVLIASRMLLNESCYPPPDLIFLIMKKYLLESDSVYEIRSSYALLNQILHCHPPSSPYIVEDDIYMEAFSMLGNKDSKLLLLAKLSGNDEVRLWNRTSQYSAEWKFYKSTLKPAVRTTTAPRLRHNAVLLLRFMTSLFEEHPKLVEKVFCHAGNDSFSKMMKSFLECFRIVAERNLKDKLTKSSEENKDETNIDDNHSDDSNEDNDDEDDNDEAMSDSHFDEIIFDLLSKTFTCLMKVLSSDRYRNRLEIVGLLFAEVFLNIGHVALDSVLSLVEFPSKCAVLQTVLEKRFSEKLALLPGEKSTSLHLIVQRYMRFIPTLTDTKARKESDFLAMDISCSSSNPASGDEKLSYHQVKLTNANVNRRNTKGETPLHRACMQNQPVRVAQLLSAPDIDPNARDYAGWTPLSEACNHGSKSCVEELLKLPLASDCVLNPPQFIDLLACPAEGMTPLHDCLDNGHLDIAKLLLEKGGIDLLHVTDKEGKTPLDICASEELRSHVLTFAHQLSVKTSQVDEPQINETSLEVPKYFLPDTNVYDELPFRGSSPSPSGWINSCQILSVLIRHFVSAYLAEAELFKLIIQIVKEASPSEITHLSRVDRILFKSANISSVVQVEMDVAYLLNWKEIEMDFVKHLEFLSGKKEIFDDYFCLNKGVMTMLSDILLSA